MILHQYVFLYTYSNIVPNQTVNIVLFYQLDKVKHRLNRWREVTAQEFPNRLDLLEMIPDADKIDIKKLTDEAVTTNTCNLGQKTCCIIVGIVSQIDGVLFTSKTVSTTCAMFGLTEL